MNAEVKTKTCPTCNGRGVVLDDPSGCFGAIAVLIVVGGLAAVAAFAYGVFA